MRSFKLDIEITEEELRDALARKVRAAVADQTNQWGTEKYIKGAVKRMWTDVVDTMVKEALENSETIKEKIAAEIEGKLKRQISAAMKAASGA
jgi:hypothetical protein